ncbi:MAG: hypothetical protein DJ555_03865 [Desulfurococcaceae archaeon]|nr:MAG: hypothetical protein DJ555_03865 [Desulfurococcaceae archaeon]
MPQDLLGFLKLSLKNLEDSIEKAGSSAKVSELSVIGSIKEVISYSEKVIEKGLCLSSSRGIKGFGYICDGRWSIVSTDNVTSISKVGSDIAISFKNGELGILREEGGLVLGPSYVRILLKGYSIEIPYNDYREAGRQSHVIKKVLPIVIDTLRKADESFSKCIKLYRLKC